MLIMIWPDDPVTCDYCGKRWRWDSEKLEFYPYLKDKKMAHLESIEYGKPTPKHPYAARLFYCVCGELLAIEHDVDFDNGRAYLYRVTVND